MGTHSHEACTLRVSEIEVNEIRWIKTALELTTKKFKIFLTSVLFSLQYLKKFRFISYGTQFRVEKLFYTLHRFLILQNASWFYHKLYLLFLGIEERNLERKKD